LQFADTCAPSQRSRSPPISWRRGSCRFRQGSGPTSTELCQTSSMPAHQHAQQHSKWLKSVHSKAMLPTLRSRCSSFMETTKSRTKGNVSFRSEPWRIFTLADPLNAASFPCWDHQPRTIPGGANRVLATLATAPVTFATLMRDHPAGCDRFSCCRCAQFLDGFPFYLHAVSSLLSPHPWLSKCWQDWWVGSKPRSSLECWMPLLIYLDMISWRIINRNILLDNKMHVFTMSVQCATFPEDLNRPSFSVVVCMSPEKPTQTKKSWNCWKQSTSCQLVSGVSPSIWS
jgi:hypothetical protein